MQPYEIDAWLGEFADEATEEQKILIGQASDALERIARDEGIDREDLADWMQDRFSAAVQLILNDTTLEEVGRAELSALTAYLRAIDESTGAMVAASLMGATPTQISRQAGVTRATVYKRLRGMR